MKRSIVMKYLFFAVVIALALTGDKMVLVSLVFAHCDTLDGPVVKDARKALETGKTDIVLKWVRKEDEPEIKKAFEKTRSVRKLNPQAKELADMYFFETLVRIHRAGEGAPYTGLKPAGSEVEPGIAAADSAVESGSVNDIASKISEQARDAVRERFEKVIEKKKHVNESVDAGREYVEAYVDFIHFVENLHNFMSAHHESHNAPGHSGH